MNNALRKHPSANLITTTTSGLQAQNKTSASRSPFDQLHSDEVVSISAVKDDEAVRRGGFKLKEEVHRGIRLQGGQA